MASPVYVWDGSSQDDADATWNSSTIAYVLLETALAAVDAGGTVYVASEHSETVASDTYVGSTNGTNALPVKVISVDKDNSDTYLAMVDDAAPGKIEYSDNSDCTFTGADIFIGLTFTVTDDMNFQTSGKDMMFYNCRFTVDDVIAFKSSIGNCVVYWENCDVEQITDGYFNFASISMFFHWKGGSYYWNGGSSGWFMNPSASKPCTILIEDVDFQDLDAGDVFLNATYMTNADVTFKRCKIPAGIGTLVNLPIVNSGFKVRLHSVSSSDIIYQLQENYYTGQINEDTATYYQATYDGTNEYSIKMVSSANAIEWIRPLRFKLAEIWCAANPTLTVELNTDNVVLQNDEFWIEIEYPDSTTGALGGLDQTSRPATIVTAPANLTTSAVAWTEAFGTEKPQKIEETISGGQAGIHTVWACLGKASATVYVCPKITVS